jgi:hypothetical protein
MKNIINFTLILILFSCGNNSKFNSKNNNSLMENYIGFWGNDNKNTGSSFRIKLTLNNDLLLGQYCATAYNGNRMDCSFDIENNISGKINDDKIDISFYSFYGAKKGVAEIKLIGDTLYWTITKWPTGGDCFAPEKVKLIRIKPN